MSSENLESESFDETKTDVMVENNAHEIYEHLKALGNDPKHRQRWVWELLQNAQDAEATDVKIIFSGNQLNFSHNGIPFTKKDITHVIFHGSSKSGEKTGKFGTGFMTTHLISKKVKIIGNLVDGRSFDFTLDREANSPQDMIHALNTSWDSFKGSISNNNVEQTSFIYSDLPSESIESIKNSLERINDTLPMVLTFSKGLKRINIVFNEIEKEYYCKEEEIKNEILITISDGSSLRLKKRELSGIRGEIAVALNQERELIQISNEIPRIFIVFPLIGTEQAFHIPFFINSPDFQPSKEREKLWLKEDTQETRINKSILEAAFKEFILMSDELLLEKTANIHLIAGIGTHETLEWIDQSWYKNQLIELSSKLDEMPLILTTTLGNISLQNAKIPCPETTYSDDLKLLELLNYLNSEIIPVAYHNNYWQKIIQERKIIYDLDDHKAYFTLEKLCKQIDSIDNHKLENLKVSSITKLEFIQELIGTLEEFNLERYWQDYAILPNQLNVLCKHAQLQQEMVNSVEELDDTLKDLADELGDLDHSRSKLLDQSIKITSPNYNLNFCRRSNVISSFFRIIKNKQLDKVDLIGTSCVRFFEWVLKNQITSELLGFPMKMQNGNWFHLSKDPYLLPQTHWPKLFIEYFDLFPQDFILHSDYDLAFSEVDLIGTPIEQLFLKSPLTRGKINLRAEEIKTLLTRKSDKDLIESFNDESWVPKYEFEVSKIAYLTSPSDKSILDRTRGSNKLSKRFLEFVTEVLLIEDTFGFRRYEFEVSFEEKTQQIGIYPSLWLLNLTQREWVKNFGANSNSSKPSTESFLPYFDSKEENQKLHSFLTNPYVSRFLYFLKIPVGDIVRNIRSDSDEERFAWDQSYVSILMNKDMTPQRVDKLLSDINFIQEYEAKEAENELRNKNAEIGTAVELAFEEAFKRLSGYKVKREPIGSDYIIESDSPHALLINKDEKTKFWIEIKSCRSQEVRMSFKQGEVAYNKTEQYILCVVPFHDELVSPELIIRNAKFITNISHLLKNRVEDILKITTLQNATMDPVNSANGINTSIDGFNVRYIVNQRHWLNTSPTVLDFSTFVNGLTSIS